MNMIEIKNLSKLYKQVIAINNMTLQIGSGITGFLGPNGAGKSTLLKILAGQLKPSKGTATIGGQPIWNNHQLNHRLGYCPESEITYHHFTGGEFVRYMVRMHGFSTERAQELALKAIETMDMLSVMDKRIGAYSKGMCQRIKLAQAIAHNPDILFLDEPLSGMDPLGRHHTIELIREWGEHGKTVIVSSHILHEIEEMTDKILLVNHGNIIAEGNIYEIRRLIDSHPLQVTLGCDKTHLLTSKLLEFDDILSVQFDRDKSKVTVQTTNPEEFYLRLPQIALKNDIQIHSIMSPDENLQAVFEYLLP